MKRILPFVLMLFLCACEMPANPIYSEYRNKDVLIEARITQKGEDYESIYRVRYNGNGDTGEITVLEPDSIAGISAQIKDGEALFGDVAILTESPSPLCAISDILKAWHSEPVEYGAEDENTFFVFGGGVRSVFSDTVPIYSEIICDGREVLHVEFLKSEVKQ